MVSKWGEARGAPGSLRKVHRALALREVFRSPGLSRVEVAERLGLSAMAVGRIVRELEQAALIGETNSPTQGGGRGRPRTALELQPDGAYVVGAVISAFSQEIVLLDLSGEIIATRKVTFRDVSDGPHCVREVCRQVKALIAATNVPSERLVGAAFAVADRVDSERGAIIGGGYLGWAPFELSALASRLLAIPIKVTNIADALIRAETFFGCARNAKVVVLVHCSTSLGASFSAAGELFHGANFRAGNIGHYPARKTQLTCACGQHNCLNCTGSGWAALHRLGLVDSPGYRADKAQAYARAISDLVNDRLVTSLPRADINRVLREAGMALAKALGFLELTCDPDKLILAGALAGNQSYFDGVLKGLKHAGPAGLVITDKLIRGGLTPVKAAGLTALLDTVFSPVLDVQRLADKVASGVHQTGDTKT